jgi:hypothetical protein
MHVKAGLRFALVVAVVSLTAPHAVFAAMSARAPQDPAAQAAATPGSAGHILTNCDANMSRLDAEQSSLPASSGELLKLIVMCRDRAQSLIAAGDPGSVFLPAMLGKDVALALEAHASELPDARKKEALAAIRRLVLAAWQLDADGDLGNREKLSQSYDRFSAAVAGITSAYGVQH